MALDVREFANLFRMAPANALEAWKARKPRILPTSRQKANAADGIGSPDAPWRYQDVLWNAHSRGFFVARVAQADILGAIQKEVGAAIQEGISLQEFSNRLRPTLEAKGWWSGEGNKEGLSLVRNPQTGQDEWTKLGTPRRLRTIYETNLSVSYSAGQYKQLKEVAKLLPWWRYVATLDDRLRPSHRALHNHVWRHDDPAWSSIWPPNDWGCRCRVEAVTERKARTTEGWIRQDRATTKEIARTVGADGPTVSVMGVQGANGTWMFPKPEWAYNPGMSQQAVEDLAWQKIQKLSPRAQKAFVDDIAGNKGLLIERRKMFEAWVQGTVAPGKYLPGSPQTVAVGWLDADTLKHAAQRAKREVSPVVLMTDESAWHSTRPTKASAQRMTTDEFLDLPAVLANPYAIDWNDGALVFYGEPFAWKGQRRRDVPRFIVQITSPRDKTTGSISPSITTAGVVSIDEVNKDAANIILKARVR